VSRLTTGGGGGGGTAATFLWHPEVIATSEAPIVNINSFNLIRILLGLARFPNNKSYYMGIEYDRFCTGSS
jgi:hypothetical protein